MGRKKRMSGRLKVQTKKTNTNPRAKKYKVELRRRIMAEIGAGNAKVFDAFAGEGVMYDLIWKDAAVYVGCDTDWFRDRRFCYVADNRRVLRAIDLQPFNIFDLDAYGSPWTQALIIADRRRLAPGELLGMMLTEGSAFKLQFGGMPKALKQLTGLSKIPGGVHKMQDKLIIRAVNSIARRLNGDVIRHWRAQGYTGSGVRYIGLVFEGK